MANFVTMATCHTCNKTSRQVGMNRNFLRSLPRPTHTPLSAVTPRSASKRPKFRINKKTPSRTPRSKPFKPPTLSNIANWKTSVFSRLKKLLVLEGSETSKKGGLKDFLTSL